MPLLDTQPHADATLANGGFVHVDRVHFWPPMYSLLNRLLLGYLSRRVLGQYDPNLLGKGELESPRLYFVEANLASVTAAAAKHSRFRFNMRAILHLKKVGQASAKVVVDLRNRTISALCDTSLTFLLMSGRPGGRRNSSDIWR